MFDADYLRVILLDLIDVKALQIKIEVDVLLHMGATVHFDQEGVAGDQGLDRFEKCLIFCICAADDTFTDAAS